MNHATNPNSPEGNPYAAHSSDPAVPPQVAAMPEPEEQGDNTGGLIPYKNPKALIAYYVGIFGLFPVIGLPLSIAAIVFGVLGLKAAKAKPIIRGTVHAWIGIILGVIATLYSSLMVFGVVMAFLFAE